MTDTPLVPSKKKGRSPSYPAIDLRQAIDRAKALYGAEKKHSAAVSTIIRHWGLSPQSGTGQVTYAALKKFGLVVEEGSGSTRHAQLSELALRIILDPRPDSAERDIALKEAALKPGVHMDLWTEYGGSLPSDENLMYQLQLRRGFTQTGAEEFIDQFRRTLAFARMGESGGSGEEGVPEDADDGDIRVEEELDRGTTPKSPSPGHMRTLDIPLSPTKSVFVRMPVAMTEDDWERMETILSAMKPSIVGIED